MQVYLYIRYIQVYLSLSRPTLRNLTELESFKVGKSSEDLGSAFPPSAQFPLPTLAVSCGIRNTSFGIFKEDPTKSS